jgi:FkbM family methyltransferase
MHMNLNMSDTAHGQIAFTGCYEIELTNLIAAVAKQEGGLLLDVGANFGYYSLLWCGLRGENRSIAFEASPKVLPHLQENIAMNNLADRIDLRGMAASNATGEVIFNVGPMDQTGWGGISCGKLCEGMVQVPAIRLDEVIDEPMIALLKIDCEGADYLVLQGAEGLLRGKRIKHICFEENQSRMKELGIEPGSAARLVRSFGYHCTSLGAPASATEFHAWI